MLVIPRCWRREPVRGRGRAFGSCRPSGASARALDRALATLFLDLHTIERSVPFLVTHKTMTGTYQLPKFEEDLFKTNGHVAPVLAGGLIRR